MSWDYNDAGWTSAVEFVRYANGGPPNVQGPYRPIPEGFPDPAAWYIASRPLDGENKHPGGTWYSRRVFTAPQGGAYGLWFGVDGRSQVYVNGELVLNTDRETRRTMTRLWNVEVELVEGENLIAVSTLNQPGGPTYNIWTVATLDEDGEPELVVARSSSATKVLDFPGTVPGVTVGWVSQRVLRESHERGELAQVTQGGYTPAVDSAGLAWPRELTHAFRMQELGRLHDELSDWGCDYEIDPSSNRLEVWAERGLDLSATVTVSAPFDLHLSSVGPVATRLLYETPGGMGRIVNGPAETDLGVVMARYVQFGTSPGPDEIENPIVTQLVRDGKPWREIDVDFPDDVRPYEDVGLGDVVTVISEVDGSTAPMRVTSIGCQVTDDFGPVWFGTAEQTE
jgi:hypothetical protein